MLSHPSQAVSGTVKSIAARTRSAPISIGRFATVTDAQGRFLLSGVPEGAQLLKVDGRGVWINGRHYTEHFLSVKIAHGQQTTLDSAIYLPRVDPASEVSISSPADHEIVLTHPAIPGLEVHIPKGAVLRERDGKIVTFDNVWLPSQRIVVKLINTLDSGMNIRTPEAYLGLLNGLGFDVETRVFHDLLRIPYDHVVMIARNRETQA